MHIGISYYSTLNPRNSYRRFVNWPNRSTQFDRVLLIEVGAASPACYPGLNERSVRVRRFPPMMQTPIQARPRTRMALSRQRGIMRGVVHGILLSLAIWVAAGYLTFILR